MQLPQEPRRSIEGPEIKRGQQEWPGAASHKAVQQEEDRALYSLGK